MNESHDQSAGEGFLRRVFMARRGEIAAMLWSAAYHFFVLFSYSMLRPFRESVGIERKYEDLAWLMTGTMAAMFIANPIFAAMVSRFPRRKFIPLTYRAFAATMLLFYALFHTLEESRIGLGYAVYIWLSVFNLFVVSVFWAFMADIFNQEQGKRLFGFIAVGGTLGALSGPLVTAALVSGVKFSADFTLQLQPSSMLLVSCACLEIAVQCVRRLLRLSGMSRHDNQPINSALRRGVEPGPGMLEGLRLIVRSPYLLLISGFILAFTILSSLLYMEQGRIVRQTFTDDSSRTVAFAQLDFYTQSLTLLLQIFISGRLMRWLGIGGTLTIVPLLSILGFAALMMRDTWMVFAMFMVFRRAFHYALDRPAREVLYTVVSADARYKSKSFIDTFVYRGGDVIGGWMERLFTTLGAAVGIAAIPLAAAGVFMAMGLGALHRKQLKPNNTVNPDSPLATAR